MSLNVTGRPGIDPSVTFLSECTLKLCSLDYAVVRYVPSFGGNLAVTSIFGAFLVAQIIFWIFYRTHSFTVAMCCGLILEIVGYCARVQMHFVLFTSGSFLLNIICLTIAPIFFMAALYVTLSRVIMHYGPHNSRVTPKQYTIFFITADVVALILQAVGGALAETASTLDGAKTGENVMVAGLSFQVISLTVFIALAGEFLWNVRRDRKILQATNWAKGNVERPPPDARGFKIFLGAFVLATLLILGRSIFRVAELAGGFRSRLANNEVAFMILEGGMVLCATLLMTAFHPGRYVGEKWKESGWGIIKRSVSLDLDKYKYKIEEIDPHPRPSDVYMRPWPLQQMDVIHK
ncbi:Sphingoid long-chain base transporter RSB1 [Lachnellula suecica]|uniref:Sphingoid long-chain base transporter RSB1 n=1 Tax=Lachnellula suecica TaxID=602035 RepID=A0A8T9CFF9_9HELO|nr:Sphingoid long-chain base transporter RSB1 [Lachnellula suecica]